MKLVSRGGLVRIILILSALAFLNPLHGNIDSAKQKLRTKARESSILGDQKAEAYFWRLDKNRTVFYQSSSSDERMGLILTDIQANYLKLTGGLRERIIIDGLDGVSDGVADSTYYDYIPQEQSGIQLARSVCRTNPTDYMNEEDPTSKDSLAYSQALEDLSH